MTTKSVDLTQLVTRDFCEKSHDALATKNRVWITLILSFVFAIAVSGGTWILNTSITASALGQRVQSHELQQEKQLETLEAARLETKQDIVQRLDRIQAMVTVLSMKNAVAGNPK